MGLLHNPFWLQLVFGTFWSLLFNFSYYMFAKDHWRGFSTRNAHMVHIANWIRFGLAYSAGKRSLFIFQLLGECHCSWTNESPRAHVAKFYRRLRLIRSVWRTSSFSVFKIDWNCNFMGLLHHPFWLQLVFWHFLVITFQLFILHVWLRITDEGSVPEMRIWSIMLIGSDLEWCIKLGRGLFLYFNYLLSVTSGGPVSPRGHM